MAKIELESPEQQYLIHSTKQTLLSSPSPGFFSLQSIEPEVHGLNGSAGRCCTGFITLCSGAVD